MSLDWLIGDRGDFERVWGYRWVVRNSADTGALDNLPPWPSLRSTAWYDTLIEVADLAGDVDLWRDGSRVDRGTLDSCGDGRLPVSELVQNGCSLIVAHVQCYLDVAVALCREFTEQSGLATVANLYITPLAANAFPAHSDDHDVLVIQLLGSKSWSLWPTQTTADLCETVILSAGEMLYVPRMMQHRALTTQEPSVHLTIGLLGPSYGDLLIDAVRSSDKAWLRRPLPFGWTGRPDALAAELQSMRGKWTELLSTIQPPPPRPWVEHEAPLVAADCAGGPLADELWAQLHAPATAFVRSGGSWTWEVRANQVLVHSPVGRELLTLPLAAIWMLSALDSRSMVHPNELPLPRESSLVLLTRMHRCGLVAPAR